MLKPEKRFVMWYFTSADLITMKEKEKKEKIISHNLIFRGKYISRKKNCDYL